MSDVQHSYLENLPDHPHDYFYKMVELHSQRLQKFMDNWDNDVEQDQKSGKRRIQGSWIEVKQLHMSLQSLQLNLLQTRMLADIRESLIQLGTDPDGISKVKEWLDKKS